MRILFLKKGQQKKFINRILSKILVKEAAKLCNLSERTIRDWRREKFLINLEALRKLCQKTRISFPSKVKIRDHYWYVSKGASAGGKAVIKKYGRIPGDSEYRKKKWYEWWEREGKYKAHFINICKPIQKPKYSKELAEFVGILLGDGGITKRQVTITLHSKEEKEYSKFVTNLIKKLFGVPVGVHYDKKYLALDLNISRTELVRFCVEKLGLKRGDKIKQQVDIPNWIRRKREYAISCVRGLIDTDGCVFIHRYEVNGKWYSYKKLAFTSHSEPLRQSVFNILKNNKLNPRLAQKKDVRLDSIEDMQRYFQLFGFHNSRHLNRYKK